METPRHGTATSLAGYLGIIRRRWLLVLIPLLIVPLAAVGFSMRQQKLFQATTKVLITNPVPVQNVTQTNVPTDPTRRSATEVDVATVPEVAQRTLDGVGLHDRSALDLLSETSVSAASDADILNFSVTDPRPGVAKRLVNEYAKQYIAYRKELDTQVVRGMVGDLQNEDRPAPADDRWTGESGSVAPRTAAEPAGQRTEPADPRAAAGGNAVHHPPGRRCLAGAAEDSPERADRGRAGSDRRPGPGVPRARP